MAKSAAFIKLSDRREQDQLPQVVSESLAPESEASIFCLSLDLVATETRHLLFKAFDFAFGFLML